MKSFNRLALALSIMFALNAAPAHAERYVTGGVSFFERVAVGFVEVTPVNIFFDDRCVDRRLCFKRDTMEISVVMHTAQGLREVILRTGQPVQVPGGLLMLSKAGTAPSNNGAIDLKKYRLEFVYIPVPAEY